MGNWADFQIQGMREKVERERERGRWPATIRGWPQRRKKDCDFLIRLSQAKPSQKMLLLSCTAFAAVAWDPPQGMEDSWWGTTPLFLLLFIIFLWNYLLFSANYLNYGSYSGLTLIFFFLVVVIIYWRSFCK